MTQTVMMTGATGYLGRKVAQELLAAGFHVRALVRDPSKVDPVAGNDLTVVPGDLLDPDSLFSASSGADAIVHVAGMVSDWHPDQRVFRQVNVEGTRNVLEAARQCRVPRVLATSTCLVFGPTDGLDVASERTAVPHRGHFMAYQRTKSRALDLCRQARSGQLDVAVVYPGALYGAGPLTDGNYLARVMHNLDTGGFPALPRTGGRRWCLAHVDDVARGHVLALQNGNPNGEYILGGENRPFDRMLELMQDGLALPSLPPKVPGTALLFGLSMLGLWHGLTGTCPPISLGGGRALLHDWAFSSARAVRELGYVVRPFEQAFPEFVEWYRAGPFGARS